MLTDKGNLWKNPDVVNMTWSRDYLGHNQPEFENTFILFQDEVAKINTEIVEGVTSELGQLTSFYLGVTNEWLEAMVITSGGNKVGIDH